MKLLSFVSILTCVYLEVSGHTKILPNELSFKPYTCDSSYSCIDCHTTRICNTNGKGLFKFLGDIKCPEERPYCDSNTGSCVSQRPSNCVGMSTYRSDYLGDSVCKNIFSCIDCNTIQMCKPTDKGLVFFKNISCSGDTPYCIPESGTCGTDQSLACGKKDDFICVHDGKFPDVDCYRFHTCTNLTSKTISCVKPYNHYDPTRGVCSESVPCESFSCLDNQGRKVPHPLDPRFFAFCGDDGPIVIDSCPAPYELNAYTQRCEATCHYNGLVQDLDDCRLYYKCTEVFMTESMSYFKKEQKQCPLGQAYDPNQYMCVSDVSNIPGCKV